MFLTMGAIARADTFFLGNSAKSSEDRVADEHNADSLIKSRPISCDLAVGRAAESFAIFSSAWRRR